MQPRWGSILLVFLSTISADSCPQAQVRLRTLQTPYMNLVYYNPEHEYIIPHLSACFENSFRFHRRMFGYTPSEPVTVLLQDFDDYGYAGASTIPSNYLTIGIEPFEYVYEVSPTNERINWVMSHELLHIVASDQAAPRDKFFRKLFRGKVPATDEAPLSMVYGFLTTPRRYAPRWFHEGMAVFMETWMAGGYGRSLGGYDEMMFRTMVADDAYFYDLVGLVSEGTTSDFQTGQVAYLYGTRFVTYLAYQHGPDKLLRWLNRNAGSKAYYATQFKNVYGVSLGSEWQRWIQWEREWQRANLASIREYPLTQYRLLSKKPLGSVSRAYFDSSARRLYTAALYPGEFAHIAGIHVDTWQVEKIAEVPTPALYYVSSLAYDDSLGAIYYTTDNQREYRDLNVVDLATGESRVLLKDCRTGDIASNRADKSIWGVQHNNGVSSLVRIPAPYEGWQSLLTLPYGTDLFDIDVSPDGEFVTASMIEVSGRQRLIRMSVNDLAVGGGDFEVLHEFPGNSPANFVYSRNGRYLFGTSYYSGVSNVYRYSFDTGKMHIITNAETGFFRPVPVSDDSLIVFKHTSQGFLPVMIGIEPIDEMVWPEEPAAEAQTQAGLGTEDQPGEAEEMTIRPIRFLGQAVMDRHPVVQDWMIGSPRDVNLDSLTTKKGDYQAIKNIHLAAAYPIVESYKDRVAWGMRFSFLEPVGTHSLSTSLLYSPGDGLSKDEKVHFKAAYRFWEWDLDATYNASDFYDLFGPTKTSRKGYSVGLQYNGSLIADRPRYMNYKLKVTGGGGLERLPDYQNVAASAKKFVTATAKLKYHSFLKTIGGLGPEKGIQWKFNAASNLVFFDVADPVTMRSNNLTKNFPRFWGEFDYGVVLPWDHSSIWLRSSLGKSFGDRDDPFANFFFGGFGNNHVDHGSIRRYREYYSLPGAELNEVGGTNFGKTMVEWTLPPKRFRRMGIQSLYANWAHLTFFGSALTTNWDNRPIRRSLLSLGGQLNFKVVMFSHLSTTFSLGVAGAFEKNRRSESEFMISLKIL